MSKIKDEFFEEFYGIDTPLWHEPNPKVNNGGNITDSNPSDNRFGNDCDCCDDTPVRFTTNSLSSSRVDIRDEKDFYFDVIDAADELTDLLISKHEDYGPSNIALAPGGPVNGLAVRLHDKVARLAHLTKTGIDPKHESLRDTFMDIANYGIIGMLVLDGKWDTE